MRRLTCLLLFTCLLMSNAANAQSLRLGVEFGMNGYAAPLKDRSPYRTTMPNPNYYSSDDTRFRPVATQPSIGLKIEKPFFDYKLAISSGVFYSRLFTYTHFLNSGFLSSDRFYVLVEQTDERVVYLSAHKAATTTNYIGIPIDVQLALAQGRGVGFYIKFSTQFNFKINSSTDVRRDGQLSLREENLLNRHFENTSDYYVNGMGSFGFRFGRLHKTNFRMEAGVPFAFTPNVGCHRITAGFGMKFAVMIPLTTSSKE